MPNVENINKVIEAIRSAGTGKYEGLGFNMASWYVKDGNFPDRSGHKCGTVACIAGWAWAVSPENKNGPLSMFNRGYLFHGRKFFEISPEQAGRLFTPNFVDLSEITVDQAVETLERLRDTGEVVWDIDETIREPE